MFELQEEEIGELCIPATWRLWLGVIAIVMVWWMVDETGR